MAEPHHRVSVEEYLAFERRSEGRHEYLDGEIFAMTGASRYHNRLAVNLVLIVGTQLRGGPCELYIADMRVRVAATGLYTYPDLAVVCGEARFDDAHLDTLLNPTLIFEILSPSTEATDRGRKFAHYRKVESLREVLLIAQDRVAVEHYSRRLPPPEGGWHLRDAARLDDRLSLPSIGCELPLADLYERVFRETA
jgi:Uma2 family endonuclease